MSCFISVIPVHYVGWTAWAIGFSSMHVMMGLTLALVFQLAHVVEDAEFVFAPGIEPRKSKKNGPSIRLKQRPILHPEIN